MRGILIGDGGGISPETSTAFRASGLSHILVASGFNITVLLIFLGVLVRRLPRVFQISILLMAIWFFVEIV